MLQASSCGDFLELRQRQVGPAPGARAWRHGRIEIRQGLQGISWQCASLRGAASVPLNIVCSRAPRLTKGARLPGRYCFSGRLSGQAKADRETRVVVASRYEDQE